VFPLANYRDLEAARNGTCGLSKDALHLRAINASFANAKCGKLERRRDQTHKVEKLEIRITVNCECPKTEIKQTRNSRN